MKFYSSQIKDLLKKIEKGQIKSLLLYGPNHGLINITIKQICKTLNLGLISLNAKELTHSQLELAANSWNFFRNRELLKVKDISPIISKEMKEQIQLSNFNNFICFIGGDSLPTFGIRKFYEEENNLASLACYYEDEQTIEKIILEVCLSLGKTIEEDALFYLKSHLKGDRQIIKNEINKLMNYTHDKKLILKDDVIKILSSNLMANGDEMCLFFSKRDAKKFLEAVEKLKEQNINEVLIIRALIRHYINLYISVIRVKNGENIDKAIKLLSPPIFFKYIPDFRQIVQQTLTIDVLAVLSILQTAEVKFKNNPKTFDFFTHLYLPVQNLIIQKHDK